MTTRLRVLMAGGFAYFWTPTGCIGWAHLEKDVLRDVHVSPARRSSVEAREIVELCLAWGARRAPVLDGDTRAFLEAHGWRASGEEDHRGALILVAPEEVPLA